MMKCEIIRDLIPLYLDKVCSEDSRKLVEEHLAECSECRKYMKELETELEAENVFYMESRMVNAVINQKAALCKKNKISLEVQITGEFHWENESNIAILLSNLC